MEDGGGDEPEGGPLALHAWEKGGPNDPMVVFDGLRDILYLVKEELSPWHWRAFATEFRDRQKADKKLQGLNALPGSGAEPKDGVVQGTPLWQERLDKMLLVEHLKKKLMVAHGEFVEAAEFILKSHGWLVKEALLADKFVYSISHVPASKSERLDLLQAALFKSRKDTEELRNAFEDFRVQLKIQRERYCQRTVEHQTRSIRRKLCDDIVVSWCYQAQKSTSLRLGQVRRVLEARVVALESAYASKAEELEESQRQWNEEKEALTNDRNQFRKMYNRMVKAHEQALEDLKNSKGSVEGQAKMIQVLSMEKHRLTQVVEELEEEKRRMLKEIQDLRDEVATLKKEIRRYGAMLVEGEMTLVEARAEVGRLEEVQASMQARLADAAVVEATLRDELLASQVEVKAATVRVARGLQERANEERLRRTVEAERDWLLQVQRRLEAAVVSSVAEARVTVQAVIARAARELEEFKNEELGKVKDEFRKKMEATLRRNAILEREVALAESVAPHLAVLNPIGGDAGKFCASCRKAIVYEGVIKEDGG